MSQKRLFTETELKNLGIRTRDLIDKAIDEGDLEKAKRLNHRMYAEGLSMHDLYRNWVASLLSYLYDHYGMEVLADSIRQTCTAWFRPLYEGIEKADNLRRKIEMFATGLRGHCQPLELVEDDEKVCIIMRPCGSGERLIQEGAYDPPRKFSIVKDPHLLTYGQPDFPIYCAHELMLQILQTEWSEHPLFVIEVPQDVSKGGCRFCFYKDRKRAPEKS